MASKLPEDVSPEDPTWLAEVTYRFAFDAVHRPLPADANAARLRLEGGNRAFAELLGRVTPSKPGRLSIDVDPHDVGLLHGHCAAPRQQPFAAVVGCADARVPVELIFSEGPNDLFVVRAAGNGMGDDVMGSLSYAVDHLKDSLRTIVVLGHSRCGAVSAAVDVHLEPAKYMKIIPQKDLRHIVDRTLVVVQLGATWLERVHGAEVSEIEVVYGVYLLDERLVWAPRGEGSDWFGLAPAPSDPNDFVKLCDLLASCPRVEALLDIA